MKTQILESETFGNAKRNYFIDFAKTKDDSGYIKITRSDKQPDGSYKRNSVVVFEDDFSFLIESFSMLFTSMIHREEGKDKFGVPAPPEFRKRGIKSWAPEKRPREKLIAGGPAALSDAELLALLIGSGTRRETAVGLASRILKSAGGDLTAVMALSHKQLCRFAGIGDAKATSIMACLELSRRIGRQLPLPFKLKVS